MHRWMVLAALLLLCLGRADAGALQPRSSPVCHFVCDQTAPTTGGYYISQGSDGPYIECDYYTPNLYGTGPSDYGCLYEVMGVSLVSLCFGVRPPDRCAIALLRTRTNPWMTLRIVPSISKRCAPANEAGNYRRNEISHLDPKIPYRPARFACIIAFRERLGRVRSVLDSLCFTWTLVRVSINMYEALSTVISVQHTFAS